MLLKIDDFEIPEKIVILNMNDSRWKAGFIHQHLTLEISKKCFSFTYHQGSSYTFMYLYPDELKRATWITWDQFDKLKVFI